MAKEAPVSFRDPYYDALDDASAKQVGIDPALLRSIRVNGERSNADQVSGAGAKSVYQITPTTRRLIEKKYGIDPLLNAENASLGAAYLLKEGLDRNKGDKGAAVAEYHGGTDTANHGPITRAYTNRVMAGLRQGSATPAGAPGPQTAAPAADATSSDFDRWIAAQPSGARKVAETALSAVTGSGSANAAEKPAAGDVGADFDQWKTNQPSLGARVADVVTGSLRETPETQALPDWATMPELNQLSLASAKTGLGTMFAGPQEIAQIIQSNFPDAKVRQDAKGNYLITSPANGQEYAIKPGFQVSDIPRALGALAAFTPAGSATSVLGQGAAAAGTQAAIEASQAATGGKFNGGEVAAAGALGAAVPAISRVASAVKGAIPRAVTPAESVAARVEPTLQPAESAATRTAQAAPEPAPELNIDISGTGAPTPTGAAPAAPAAAAPAAEASAPLSAAELNATARKAAEGGIGSSKAKQVLAEQAAPDAETVAAAERLGIADNLQPDHVTTNQAYRELAQAVKSVPGSEARVAELEGLQRVAQRADDLVSEIGGTKDVSTLNQDVRRAMESTQQELEAKANELYGQIRAAIPANARVEAPNVLQFIAKRAEDLGGDKNLSPLEKMIRAKLTPKSSSVMQEVPGLPGGTAATSRTVREKIGPTYTLMDDVRKDVGAAARQGGPFKDADTGLAKKLYELITSDQDAAVQPFGMTQTIDAAKAAVRTRKALEDDLTSLFGKNLGDSIVGDLSSGVSALAKGDTGRFLKLIQSVPPEMRQRVTASGLNYAFNKQVGAGNINFNTFARWYEGLQRNQQAFNALMANLPPEARQSLSDLYKVANGISLASKERIMTGRLNAVTQELRGADTLLSRIYDVAKRSATGLAAEAVTTPLGLPGAGLGAGIASALTKGKTDALKAADKLIASPEFIAIAKNVERGQPPKPSTVKQLARSSAMREFARKVNDPEMMRDRERWLMSIVQSANETQH